MAKRKQKRQFPYSTIKSRLYKEYKDAGFSGGWRGEGLKTLTGQVYAEFKLGHLGSHKSAKRIPKKVLLGAARELIPALEAPDVEEAIVPYWGCHEETLKLQSVLKDNADTTLVIPNFTDSFFLADYDYYTHYKNFVDSLNKRKIGSDEKLTIKAEYNLTADKWVIRINWMGDGGPGEEEEEPAPGISDEDLTKLTKKERKVALGGDKIKEISQAQTALRKDRDLFQKQYDKEVKNYVRISSLKKADDVMLGILRENIVRLNANIKNIDSAIMINVNKLGEITKKIKS